MMWSWPNRGTGPQRMHVLFEESRNFTNLANPQQGIEDSPINYDPGIKYRMRAICVCASKEQSSMYTSTLYFFERFMQTDTSKTRR